MSALFDAGINREKAAAVPDEKRGGVCPACGKNAVDIQRMQNGRFMAVHAVVDRPFVGRATGAVLMIKSAVLCHGVE